MPDQFQIFHNLAIKQIDAITSLSGAFAQNVEKFFAETRDFQRVVLLNNSAWFSKVAFARNVSDAIKAQTEPPRQITTLRSAKPGRSARFSPI
jgi:hypothetical protein